MTFQAIAKTRIVVVSTIHRGVETLRNEASSNRKTGHLVGLIRLLI